MVTANPHGDLEAYFADRDNDCRHCGGSGEREMSDTACGPDCHTQLVSCPYCQGTGARMDCLPVPVDRHQGWPGVYAVLYTDSINDEQTCRDDLWVTTGKAIRCVVEKAQTEAYADGRDDERKSLSKAAQDILAERERQQTEEGYTTARDDFYVPDDLADAAAAYALIGHFGRTGLVAEDVWPWPPASFKPRDQRRNYVRAAALLQAAIELIDRQEAA